MISSSSSDEELEQFSQQFNTQASISKNVASFPFIKNGSCGLTIELANDLKIEFIESDVKRIQSDIVILPSFAKSSSCDHFRVQGEYTQHIKSLKQGFLDTGDVSILFIILFILYYI